MRNIFDQYIQPENRLTHTLVSTLANERRLIRPFLRWLSAENVPPLRELQVVEQQVPGEAVAAGLFAQAGCDVSVQYGADQPEHDLIVAKGDAIKKASVKGSQTGSWGLGQSFLKGANYSKAISRWLSRHGRNTLMCFVQFKGTDVGQCPRVYLGVLRELGGWG